MWRVVDDMSEDKACKQWSCTSDRNWREASPVMCDPHIQIWAIPLNRRTPPSEEQFPAPP